MKYAHPPMNPTPKPHDPRIAALAEALHATYTGCMSPYELCPWLPSEHQTQAAAILAALPFGWDSDSDEEWRRLRKIEEAARDYTDNPTGENYAALRAALGSER